MLTEEHTKIMFTITAALLALLGAAIVGRGHVADSRLDAREYPFHAR